MAHIAAGGNVQRGTGKRVDNAGQFGTKSAGRTVQPGRGNGGGSLAKSILDIAFRRMDGMVPTMQSKALAESTDTAGGFLLTTELADSVLMLIRNRAAVTKMPITTVAPRPSSTCCLGWRAARRRRGWRRMLRSRRRRSRFRSPPR